MKETFNGMVVVESTAALAPKTWTLRKFQIRPWINVSEEFRASMDAWLLATFGDEQEVVQHGQEPAAYVLGGKTLVIHPVLLLELRARALAR